MEGKTLYVNKGLNRYVLQSWQQAMPKLKGKPMFGRKDKKIRCAKQLVKDECKRMKFNPLNIINVERRMRFCHGSYLW